MGNITRKNK